METDALLLALGAAVLVFFAAGAGTRAGEGPRAADAHEPPTHASEPRSDSRSESESLPEVAPAPAQEGTREHNRERELRLDPGPGWKVIGLFSGGESYYTITSDADGNPVLHADYHPPQSTVVFGYRLDKPKHYRRFSWRWRVERFPVGADEKVEGHIDNAAGVYLTLSSGLRRYVIKYVWSTKYEADTHWRTTSNLLEKMELVVRRGPPEELNTWHSESVNIADEFHRYFGGDDDDEPPPVAGVGVLSDGDGTRCEVEADYAGFVLR